MALVRVAWTETREFEAIVEVPDFDYEHGEPGDLRDAVAMLAPWERIQAETDVDVDITAHEIVKDYGCA